MKTLGTSIAAGLVDGLVEVHPADLNKPLPGRRFRLTVKGLVEGFVDELGDAG